MAADSGSGAEEKDGNRHVADPQSGMSVSREVELVLRIRAEDLHDLQTVQPGLDQDATGRGAALVRPVLAARSKRVVTTYYDTGDFAFRRRGFALRVREAGGSIVQTVKTSAATSALVKDRQELDTALTTPEPDPSAVTAPVFQQIIAEQLGVKDLKRLFRTVIDRQTCHFRFPDNTILELCMDRGVVHAGGRAKPVSELELELVRGTPDALYEAARDIAGAVPVRIGVYSKADRGYHLFENKNAPIQNARPVLLAQGTTVGAASQEIIAACLSHALANEPAVVEDGRVEGIHQMRVGLRRLRAALALFAKPLRQRALADLGAEARALAARLGDVRDLDVLMEELMAPVMADRPQDRALARLADLVTYHRADRREALCADWARSSRVAEFALAMEACLREAAGRRRKPGAWDRPAAAFARSALRRRWARVSALGQRIDDLSIPERHALRIQIKKLRYTGDFFASLFGERRIQPYLRDLAQLQTTFGALNDLATAERLLPQLLQEADTGGKAMHQAVDRIIDWHRDRARKAWRKTRKRWKQVCDREQFWEQDIQTAS